MMAHFLLSKNNQNSVLKKCQTNYQINNYIKHRLPFMQLIQLSYDYFDAIDKMSNQNVFSLLVRETTHCYYFLCAFLGFQNGARSRCHRSRAG